MILVKSHSLEHATVLKTALGDQVSVIHCQGRMTFKEVLPAFPPLYSPYSLEAGIDSELSSYSISCKARG